MPLTRSRIGAATTPRSPALTGFLRWSAQGIVLGTLVLGSGCAQIQAQIDTVMGGGAGVSEEVKGQLKSGQITAAKNALATKNKDNPKDVETANHYAYTQMLGGDYAGADATLAAAEEGAEEGDLAKLKLRRAMVALRAHDLDAVRDHGRASNLPEGLLLAAEVYIQDLDEENARTLLDQLQSNPGTVGATAKKYLELYNGTPEMNSLADLTALWALGEREEACDNASQVIPQLPDDDQKSAQLLLWAGRAATSGQVDVASALLAEILSTPDPKQSWRIKATEAIIAIGQGEYQKGLGLFKALEGGAPADGLAHARATAAALAGDQEIAEQLVADLESPAVARGLLEAGAKELAAEAAPAGSTMKKFMD